MYKIKCNGRVEISVNKFKPRKKEVRLRKVPDSDDSCMGCHYYVIHYGCTAGTRKETKTGKLLYDICNDEDIIFELVK